MLGEIVLYHFEDGDVPAMVLGIEAEVLGQDESGADIIGDVMHLQVFRPRGNFWARAVEGVNEGMWSHRIDLHSHPDAIKTDLVDTPRALLAENVRVIEPVQ